MEFILMFFAFLVLVGLLSIAIFYIVERFVLPRCQGSRFHKWWRRHVVTDIDMEP
jgi:hypothetical protein